MANPAPTAELAERSALVADLEPDSVPIAEFIDLNPAPLHAPLAAVEGPHAEVKPNV